MIRQVTTYLLEDSKTPATVLGYYQSLRDAKNWAKKFPIKFLLNDGSGNIKRRQIR